MIMKTRLVHVAILLAFALSLSACGSDKSAEKPDTEKAVATTTPKPEVSTASPICPQVAIIRELESIQDFGGEKPSPAEFVASAKMVGIDGDCAYTKDGIDVKFELNFVAQRGPRLGGLHIDFPYFIAVVDPEQNILNKERMVMPFGFSSENRRTQDNVTLHVFIPLDKAQQALGPNYQILTGFQLTKEQVDMGREER
jgi:hypothetical protein